LSKLSSIICEEARRSSIIKESVTPFLCQIVMWK
jgi:hypothetical protein